MGERREINGVIYEKGDDGVNRRVQEAQPQGGGVSVVPLPMNPQEKAAEARAREAAARDGVRTGIAERGESRSVTDTAFNQASKLRDDFQRLQEVKDYQTVIRQFASAIKTQATPTGDQALITAYAKMLDPGSVVRDQEFNTVAAGDSTIGQAIARLNKELGADQAGLLRQEVRDRVRSEMLNLTKSYNQAYNLQRQRFRDMSQRGGFNADDVIGPHLGQPYFQQIEERYNPKGAQGVQAAPQAQARGEQPLPNGMQQANAAFMANWDGNPDSYVRFRKALDQQFNYQSAPDDELHQWAATAAEARAKGMAVPIGIPSPKADPNSFQQSAAGQGMSGVNTGIANALGAPVDLATAALNAIPQGINAVANTDIPTIDKPFLGSESIKDGMNGWGIYGPSDSPTNQFVRRIGESVGAASVPLAGAGSFAAAGKGLLAAAGGGVGAATANHAFPGSGLADFVGDVAGSGVVGGGLLKAGQRFAQSRIESRIPTVDNLKEQAGELYRQAEARGVTADPTMTQDLADRLRGVLVQGGRISPTGRISEVYPKAKEAVQLVDDYAGNTMNPTQLQTVRGVVTDGLMSQDGNERHIARQLTDEFDNWANPQAPELSQARDISSRYLATQQLERARELATARASQFGNSGMENALRTEYRALDRNAIKGNSRFDGSVTSAIENVSRGTPGSNLLRNLGRLAPETPFSGVSSMGAGAGLGFLLGGPAGAGVGGVVAPLVGKLSRAGAEKATARLADVAEMTARNGGAVPQASLITPESRAIIRALAASTFANSAGRASNGPRGTPEDRKRR